VCKNFVEAHNLSMSFMSPRLFIPIFLISLAWTKSYVYFSDQDPIIDLLVKRIEREKEGIDIAIYSFTHPRIADALTRASHRGVEVRLIMDSSSRAMADKLCEAGLSPVAVVASEKESFRPLFHHKFVIFRKNESNRPWVWTGSFNLSRAAEKKNFENVLLVDTKSVVHKYRDYFDSLMKAIENKPFYLVNYRSNGS